MSNLRQHEKLASVKAKRRECTNLEGLVFLAVLSERDTKRFVFLAASKVETMWFVAAVVLLEDVDGLAREVQPNGFFPVWELDTLRRLVSAHRGADFRATHMVLVKVDAPLARC